MKHKQFIFTCGLLLTTCLSSCGECGVHHEAKDYFLDIAYKKDFKILQMSDIHLGMEDDLEYHYRFMDLTISEAKPDMLMVTGDLFTFATESVMESLFNYLDSHDIPWAVTYGNHDEQVYFSISSMSNALHTKYKNCVYIDHLDDDVFGNANYVINLKDGDITKYELFVLDSNRYRYGQKMGYDYIHQDQIDWYERMVNYSNEINGRIVPSLAFFHIPFEEYQTAYDLYQSGSSEVTHKYGENREKVSSPKINSGFFSKLVDMKSTKATFVGHDHVNYSHINYQGIDLVYGIHSTDRVYHDEDLLGGLLITIHDDESLSYNRIFHSYLEVER